MSRNVVFIPGLFGARISNSLLKEIETKYNNSVTQIPPCDESRHQRNKVRILAVTPGPLSSVHDRAVEIFYQLYGGRVDYGQTHSHTHQHNRYGSHYPGLLSPKNPDNAGENQDSELEKQQMGGCQWDSDHPIDIVSYSLGAPTARYLQHLLIMEAFTDENGHVIPTSGDWIRSITTLQGTNNGSHAVHMVGLGVNVLEPVKFTILWAIFMFCYVVHWIFGSWLNYIYPINLEHWECSHNEKTLGEVFEAMPLLSENAAKDLSPKRMLELNKEMSTTLPHPSTFYLACVAVNTQPIKVSETLSPSLATCHLPNRNLLTKFPETLILSPFASLIGLFGGWMNEYAGLNKIMKDEEEEIKGEVLEIEEEEEEEIKEIKQQDDKKKLRIEDHLLDADMNDRRSLHHLINHQPKFSQVCNDGIVSLAGQRHPIYEKASPIESVPSLSDLPPNLERGMWHHLQMNDWNHMETMKWGTRQRVFFDDLLAFLLERLD